MLDITVWYYSSRLNNLILKMQYYSFQCIPTHSYVTCLIHTWHVSSIRNVSHSYGTCLIHTWHVSFIRDISVSCGTCLIRTNQCRSWHNSLIAYTTPSYVIWLICIPHNSSTSVLIHSYVTCLIHMWHVSFKTMPSKMSRQLSGHFWGHCLEWDMSHILCAYVCPFILHNSVRGHKHFQQQRFYRNIDIRNFVCLSEYVHFECLNT